ncbi:MAG: n-acetylglutamate synthase [Chloroflexota bacterium]
MNYNNRQFKGRSNSENGEVSSETIFHYFQEGSKFWGTYSGGTIIEGHLLGKVLEDHSIKFLYHHLNQDGDLLAGRCSSKPKSGEESQLVLEERWQWLTGDRSEGYSEVEEII